MQEGGSVSVSSQEGILRIRNHSRMVLKSGMVEGAQSNITQEHAEEEKYAMELLFTHHNIAMTVACFSSLTLGLLLVINMLTQLKARSY